MIIDDSERLRLQNEMKDETIEKLESTQALEIAELKKEQARLKTVIETLIEDCPNAKKYLQDIQNSSLHMQKQMTQNYLFS